MRFIHIAFLLLATLVVSFAVRAIPTFAQESARGGWELNYAADVAAQVLYKSVVFVETRFDKPRNDDIYAPWAYFRGGRPLYGLYGSGFIYKDPKYVITVPFVLDKAEYVRVTTWDGRSFPATVKGKNEVFQTAVLEVDWGRSFVPEPAKLADPESLRVGQAVSIAGRSEDGRDFLTTVGVISAIRKEIPTIEQPTEQYIQFDAAYSLPMTGGPLANTAGEVVGVVYGTVMEFGGTNVNLAVPVGDLMMAADRIIEGKIQTPWHGVEGLMLTSQIRQLNRVPDRITEGVFITYVEPGSPGDIAGLKAGDIVIEIEGQPIPSAFDFRSFMRRVEVGQVVRVKFWRFVVGVSDDPKATGGDTFETVIQILPFPEEEEEEEESSAGGGSGGGGGYHH